VSALIPEQIHIQVLEKQVKQLKSNNQLLKKHGAFFTMEINCGSK